MTEGRGAELGAGLVAAGKAERRKRRRVWAVLAFVMLGLGVAFFTTIAVVAHRASPILRARVINTLSTRFHARVELPELDLSVVRGIDVTGRGLKLFPDALDSDQALFKVGEFHFYTPWWSLLRSPMHVGTVELTDLEIYKPTKAERERMKAEAEDKAQAGRKNKVEIYVDDMTVDRATLVMGTDVPGKDPLRFEIHALKLEDVSSATAMRFHATLVNPKPIGDIETTGYFGPYDVEEPGESPVHGGYEFSHADLNTIKGIGGLLSSRGVYTGKLDTITVDGTTDTPNFSLDIAGRPMPLKTKFHAVVDGLNGNTYLQPVIATLGRAHIVARGKVERAPNPDKPGRNGRHVKLQVEIGPADIADMLKLAVKTEPPLMHGALRLSTSFDLPPGAAGVPERMKLHGRFAIHDAVFTNPKIQEKVNQLSLRAQGEAKEAGRRAKEEKEAAKWAAVGAEVPRESAAGDIQSEMEGEFVLGDARLELKGLEYHLPGADVTVNGVYTLDGNKFDLTGDARMKAHVSQMVTGWKSLLLKPVDPFFAKNGAGTEVPFTVTGTKAEPKFGVEVFGRKIQEK